MSDLRSKLESGQRKHVPRISNPIRTVCLAALAAAGVSACTVLPKPLTELEVTNRVDADLGSLYAAQEPVRGAIDFHEAVARGLKYNLDKRLKLMELGLADAQRRYTHVDLLPKLASQAGYRSRDSFRGSSSRSLITGQQSLEVSTSEDRRVRSADLQVVWNVLDFGLSYIRAVQDADRVMIADERRVKVAQNMILDVRDSFWRAYAAQEMMPEVNLLISRMRSAIRKSRRVSRSGNAEPSEELKLQRDLLQNLRQLLEVRRNLMLAKSELAALMNLPVGTKYRLSSKGQKVGHVPHLRADVVQLERIALMNRPELREEDYKFRIAEDDLRAAWVRLLPGIEFRAGPNYDSNSFLFENNWANAGIVVTKNLMEILTAPKAIEVAERGVDVARARRMALSMAVITQVRISLQRFKLARDIYGVSRQVYRVDRRLSSIAENSRASEGGSDNEALAALSKKVVSRLEFFSAYADVQNSYGRVLNSLGVHRFPGYAEDMGLDELAHALRGQLDIWQGTVPAITIAGK